MVDNAIAGRHGREILLAHFDELFASFSQSREGYHEIEFRLQSLQVDNHVPSSIHPVLIFCPKHNHRKPFIHLSAVRRLQELSTTYVFRYAAFRMLEVSISLDRRTAESVVHRPRAQREPRARHTLPARRRRHRTAEHDASRELPREHGPSADALLAIFAQI